MIEKIRKNAFGSPILSAICYSLFAVAIFSVPTLFKVADDFSLLLHALCRTAATVLALVLAKILGFKLLKFNKITLVGALLLLAGLIVSANNFPFIGIISGRVTVNENANVSAYAFYCVMVGISEEAVFRALVLPLVLCAFPNGKYKTVKAVSVCALIFSACHIFNVFSAGVGATALQVGYTFLTGAMFSIVFIITGNMIIPAFLHIVFDIGGLMFSAPFGIARGNMWDTLTVIITAVLGVAVTVVYTVYAFKSKND